MWKEWGGKGTRERKHEHISMQFTGWIFTMDGNHQSISRPMYLDSGHTRTHTHILTHTHTHTYKHTHTNTHTHTHTLRHTHIHTYTQMRAHNAHTVSHTNTHIHSW